METQSEQLKRALVSLDGLSVGDAFGIYATPGRVRTRQVFEGQWYYTDDTNMALSIVSILRRFGKIDQDALADDFAVHFENGRGYGPGMRRLLPAILQGQPWQEAASALFRGVGSFGNGGAMRIAPLGAYFSDDLATVAQQAALASEVTHAHPEGIAGGVAIAVGAAVAQQARGTALARSEFISRILPYIPKGEVCTRVKRAQATTLNAREHDITGIVSLVGNGEEITAQDTVAYCLWCAGEMLNNYPEALWLTASGGGDVDTNCAIVGGMVTCYTRREGIPAEWLAHRESLPAWATQD